MIPKNKSESTLESWLWDATCTIRGPLDAPKFKDYILPLVFLKRLSDVFEDEVKRLGQEFGGEKEAAQLAEADHPQKNFYQEFWPEPEKNSLQKLTTLDRVHAAILLQAGGQTNALRALLKAEQECGQNFLRLANALSALYPINREEKKNY